MSKEYQLRGYMVAPLSTEAIRKHANNVRDVLCLPDEFVDLGIFLESLVNYAITLDVIDDVDMPGFSLHSEACCIPETATIYLTSETYTKACSNDPRTRFTIFHELGHLVLCHTRKLHRGQDTREARPYMDSEWQADQFAAEITMPLNIIMRDHLFAPNEIQKKFGVSSQAAQIRYDYLVKNRIIKKIP